MKLCDFKIGLVALFSPGRKHYTMKWGRGPNVESRICNLPKRRMMWNYYYNPKLCPLDQVPQLYSWGTRPGCVMLNYSSALWIRRSDSPSMKVLLSINLNIKKLLSADRIWIPEMVLFVFKAKSSSKFPFIFLIV